MPIRWHSIADYAGLTPSALSDLLEGKVHAVVAERLGLTVSDVMSIIDGNPSISAARVFPGLEPPAAVQELTQALGRAGAIAFIIAMLMPRR